MRVGVIPRMITSIVDSGVSANVGQGSRSLRIDSCQDVIMNDDINKEDQQEPLEVGHGSFIEFYKNGVL